MKSVNLKKKYVLSYPDSIKILDEALKKDHKIDELLYQGIFESKKEAIKMVNKLLYDTAERMGASLYDICFRTVPEYSYNDFNFDSNDKSQRFGFKQEVRLVPVEFDLTHDGGYWKNKYFSLKDKMQKLLDNKEGDEQ